MSRLKTARRVTLFCQELESRFVPANIVVPLDPNLDQFGDQIGTVQAYGDGANSTFGIFDTGASAITFSPDDQATMHIPIAYPGGAVAGGIGGEISGDISAPGTILADGLHTVFSSADPLGFSTTLDPATSAAAPGVQAFVGTATGSPNLPTITGTPILNGSLAHPNGMAAKINLQGVTLDYSDLIPGFTFSFPDVHFVNPGTAPDVSADSTAPVYIPLGFFGDDNHTAPGDQITVSPSPMQPNVSLVYQVAAPAVTGKHFLLDTGAQLSVVSTATALQLGLDLNHPETTQQVQGVGGAETIYGYTLNQLVLPTTDGGTLTYTNVPIYVLDVAPDLDGILGMNLFDTANSMVYDPFNPAGSRLGVTFHTSPRNVVDGSLSGLLSGGFPFFAGLLYGHSLPGFEVSAAAQQTTTALASTPNASTGGTLVTLTATIAPSPGNLGTVTFKENGNAIAGGLNVHVVNGVATMQISSLSPGNHPIVAAYSGATGFAASNSSPLTQVVATVPNVVSVTPNGNIPSLAGGGQHSRVASLVVVFDQPVALDANALALALHTNHVVWGSVDQPDGFGSLPDSLVLATTDHITWTVTFSGNTEANAPTNDGLNSLKDGVYDLNINSTRVHPLGVLGVRMASNYSYTFDRLFGDIDVPSTPVGGVAGVDFGAIVNTPDNQIFRGSFNNPTSYLAYLDTDGDHFINTTDNLQFRTRFNKPLTWKV